MLMHCQKRRVMMKLWSGYNSDDIASKEVVLTMNTLEGEDG